MKFVSYAILAAVPLMSGCLQDSAVMGPPLIVSKKADAVTSSRNYGYTAPIIRTYLPKETDETKVTVTAHSGTGGEQIQRTGNDEVSGVTCRLDSAELFAEFVTPITLKIPVLIGKPSPIQLTCANQEYTGSLQIHPRNGDSTGSSSLAKVLVEAAISGGTPFKERWYLGYDLMAYWVPLEMKSGQ